MKTHKLAGKGLTLVLAGVLLASLVAISGGANAGPLAQGPTTVESVTDIAPVLHYQGRLLDPTTGNPKPNGTYQMIFSIYNVETGGSPLWSETKGVAVTNGLFSVLLGDTVALDPGIFNGQALWLGVTVGVDPEAVPRQRIAHSPYALHSQHASQASELGGFPPSAFAPVNHEHNGADITSGTVAAPRIDPAIARDDEIMPIVLNSDGPGSGLDADKLDGQHAADFAVARHTHTGNDIADGSIDTPDLANAAVTTSKIADGAVTATKLASGVVPRFFSLEPYAAYLEGSAGFRGGFGPHAGIFMPDGSNSSFAFGFTIPPDYTAGVPLTVRLIWHTSSTNCGIELRPNFISVARAGQTHIIGSSASTGLDAVGGTVLSAPATANQSGAKDYTITSPVTRTTLQPGDSIIFGLYRCYNCSADTCTGDLMVQGVRVIY